MYDVIIVGAGIAGMTAAIYAERAGKSVLLLENGAYGGQIVNAERIENWPGEIEISGADLSEKIYHQVNNLSVEFLYEKVLNVEVLEGGGFLVKTDEAEHRCGAMIIATGTEPRRLSDKQARDAGDRAVSYCATCDGALFRGKPVVVVGSGKTAEHEMWYLSGIASKVYNIHHDDPIPEEAEAVFVAIGRIPNTEVFRALVKVDEAGYVVAGEDCHTSRAGVFVAGDARTKSVRQLVTAAGDGAIAAGEAVKFLGGA